MAEIAVRYKTQWMEEPDKTCWGFSPKIRIFVCGALAVLCTLLLIVIMVLYGLDVVAFYAPTVERDFSTSVEAYSIYTHLVALQDIAAEYNNSRAMDLGYNASVDYVATQLEPYASYFDFEQQYFTVDQVRDLVEPELSLVAPQAVDYVYGVDFIPMEYSGSGTVTNEAVVYVGEGCDEAAYTNAGFPPGAAVALAVRTSTCRVRDQAAVAAQVQVLGLMIYNSEDGLFSSSAKTVYNFPIFSLSHEVGTYMVQTMLTDPVSVTMYSLTEEYTSVTSNYLAQTKGGAMDSIIITGSHLDSVPEGPGINDNGSGSAANLEMAIQFAKLELEPVNSVIFAWWGAEELGLKGSTYYVAQLKANGGLENVALNLNYDMIGSANYFRGIYNGSQADANIRTACETITRSYEGWFDEHKFAFAMTEFDGRSDYGPFLEEDIPAGGLFTGAEQLKTVEERLHFQGLANSPYDSCYHKHCDTVENINRQGLAVMADAAAQVVYDLAMQDNLREFLNGTLVE
eukprot:CAMPEP_0114627480 /NCGR_PEP_ID=MMETSP0168-20121206/12320_1 /TAXON_ID=95228 ORGANISM="Vannella sp., Strain DIVA3 517/6/12" /NCGR_SAMPLE_ID=MMETSP0168 /ASSEMBLY_ACC=CAM_ASM_000044 /LENGTH=512 /DNA_ID=CAMNT_0001838819 /DNA_START=5 /DNA_END=1543 /DNA_ORIENTATION=-